MFAVQVGRLEGIFSSLLRAPCFATRANAMLKEKPENLLKIR